MGESTICTATGKICLSQRDAGNIKNRYSHHRERCRCGQNDIPQRSYRCPYCNTYHLTHLKRYRFPDIELDARSNQYPTHKKGKAYA